MTPTSTSKLPATSIGSSESKARRNRFLLQDPDGFYLTTIPSDIGVYSTSDATAAHAFVDVDAAAARAKALIANGIIVARIAPFT